MGSGHVVVNLTRLETMPGLEEKHRTLLCNSKQEEQVAEYEVEEVKGVKYSQGKTYFLIKWKGWESSYNSWEVEDHVEHCQHLVREYCFRSNSTYRLTLVRNALRKVSNLYQPDVFILAKLTRFTVPADGFISRKDIEDMRKKVRSYLSGTNGTHKLNIKRGFGSWKEFLEVVELREQTAMAMAKWENYINAASGEKAVIHVENFVDCEAPPQDFVYLKDYRPGPGVVINDDPPVGCSCVNCLEEKQSCCAEGFGMSYAYNRWGTLLRPFGAAVYECNKRCACRSDCNNRVVQKGRQVPLVIFRTGNGRGWGVRTLQRIKKGTFVMEYLGEIITNEEAEKRGRLYDAEGMTYLFDLDYTEPEPEDGERCYCVDAAKYGNVAHFVNHSCDPNLAVWSVWVNNLDTKMPRLAFFTVRDVRQFEELTINYRMEPPMGLGQMESPTRPLMRKRVLCKCGAANCQKYLC